MTILAGKRSAVLVPAIVVAGLISFGASAASGSRFTATSAQTARRLVAVRASHRAGYDRVVFDFAGGLPTRRNVRYVGHLIADPLGRRIRIAGRAILEASFFPATAQSATGHSTAPARVAFALPSLMSAVRAGDFEAVLSYGLGLARRTSFHVFTPSNRAAW
ncbi:MAG TPA: hypothetical protein VFP55_09765 [Solirubrobacteraceae bacterium]|nr:hypothetical protein [Solirubrobacteraceae bacterium]